ncbi:MAG: 23S rRNA (uracil(1939)-C(5))-methyltransferase RlmD [Rhodocyclaceae bacterium]|nr:23S rRNA (uracil(1939)-C(5))-methyltransferase RlmD [Rhodocyclaceae bacterium]
MPGAIIESLDHDGRGVCHAEGKVVFIDGGLPGEQVTYEVLRRKPRYETGDVLQVLRSSALRVPPRCPHFGHCGGCSMQHLDSAAQPAIKQRVLEDALRHLGGVAPGMVLPPIQGPAWHYRHRARLTVRLVPSKGGLLVGFHERRSSHVADMQVCHVLPAHVARIVEPLRALISGLSRPDRIPQVEVAVGDDSTALVLRHLEPLTSDDLARVGSFEDRHGIRMWLQPGRPDTARPLRADAESLLHYGLPELGLRLGFRPTDFTQVNPDMNRLLIRRAMQLLDPAPGERIVDLFCGLGNFSLPMARRSAAVVGVEGSAELVERARANAQDNGLGAQCAFYEANLFEATEDSLDALGPQDKWLIDPPREGAIAVVKALGRVRPGRIVYVSCNPATLARDAAVLVHQKGYRLRSAGIANMFPQTSHVESIALFELA